MKEIVGKGSRARRAPFARGNLRHIARAACLIICRFGVAPYPVLDSRFFILFMSVMHLGMEPAQFDDFIQGTGDRHGATLFAGILSTVNFKSIGYKNHDPFSSPSTAEIRFIARTAAQPNQVIKQKEKNGSRFSIRVVVHLTSS